MKISRKLKCPYCGTEIVYINIDLEHFGEQEKILTCDVDMGGCDKNFAIKLRPSLNIEIGKIEYDNQKIT